MTSFLLPYKFKLNANLTFSVFFMISQFLSLPYSLTCCVTDNYEALTRDEIVRPLEGLVEVLDGSDQLLSHTLSSVLIEIFYLRLKIVSGSHYLIRFEYYIFG